MIEDYNYDEENNGIPIGEIEKNETKEEESKVK